MNKAYTKFGGLAKWHNRQALSHWPALLLGAAVMLVGAGECTAIDFDRDIHPLLSAKCLKCHAGAKPAAGLRLTNLPSATAELESGERAIVPGKPELSQILRRVASEDADERMPPKGEPLSKTEIDRLREWIAGGADWPAHWAYRGLAKPPAVDLPLGQDKLLEWCRTPIDRFVVRGLIEHQLAPSAPADRRTLLRRVYFDLIGLPPTPNEVQAFLADSAPDAYERVVDRLLASPHYGERFARHWMDLVHFAESHGQDQDRPREHAWPYRDYLIRSFNEDKPFARFVAEQVAGDVLYPDDSWATVATGMLAAGPWDESSLRDIRDDTPDREIARYLDRDDIVATVMNTFTSTTVQCARCHDHKFDPISQKEYYALQAVFAGTDKAERPYDADPAVARERHKLNDLQARLPKMLADTDPALLTPELTSEATAWEEAIPTTALQWQAAEVVSALAKEGSQLVRLDDGSLLASGPTPLTDTYTIVLRTPLKTVTGLKLEVLPHESLPYSGPGRAVNGNLHLSELNIDVVSPTDAAAKRRLKLSNPTPDFDQEGWTFAQAIDGKPETAWGIHPQEGKPHHAIVSFAEPVKSDQGSVLQVEVQQLHGRSHVIGRLRLSLTDQALPGTGAEAPLSADVVAALAVPRELRSRQQQCQVAAAYLTRKVSRELAALPQPELVFSGTSHFKPEGSFRPTAVPRKVFVLRRGNLSDPLDEAGPGALSCLAGLEPRFALNNSGDEGQRRAALAHWLVDSRNALTWRSIANRVWYYHFGRGLVETLNDFGQMGAAPTHPELLDWLAVTLQENGGSLKTLHRMIVTSAVYRQASDDRAEAHAADQSNQWLWRMNRRRLDAESVRDSLLLLSGKLDPRMGGPSAKQFIQTPGVHVTPVVNYAGFNLDDPANYRRNIYRFIFRTLPDPFMESLDCPDASQLTPQRTESVTALQALATVNDRFLVHQCEQLAERLSRENPEPAKAVEQLFWTLLDREPTPAEATAVAAYAAKHGLANACRFLINTNEFMFVD